MLGQETLLIENQFNLNAGLSPKANDLPSFFRDEPDTRGDYFDVDRKEMAQIFDK